MIMERVFARCHKCDDTLEMEYRKGRWHCENCGANLTESVERQLRLEAEFNKKHKK